MPTSKKDSSMVVTRDWNFPRVFITDSLDARMIGSFANAFHELIFQANFDDKAWASRMETFRKHGLLDLAIYEWHFDGTFSKRINIPSKVPSNFLAVNGSQKIGVNSNRFLLNTKYYYMESSKNKDVERQAN